LSNRTKTFNVSPGWKGRAILFYTSWVFLFLLIFLPKANAQNIIPNGGFEDPAAHIVRSWEQPHGEYRHYEHDSIFAASGEFYNGICMYSSRPNEYFLVPFTEELKAGKSYHLSMKVRVWKEKCIGFYELDSLGFRFDSVPQVVSSPFYCFLNSDLKLAMNVQEPGKWYELNGTYTARGNEKYLMIGNFFERAESQVDLDKAAEEMSTSSNMKKKSKKKKEKDYADFRKMLEQEREAALPKNDTGAYFMVRYYFDDVCLAPIADDGSHFCDPKPIVPTTGDVFVGKSIQFETDKATLLESSYVELNTWVEMLKGNESLKLQIIGHTDDTGDPEHNRELSMARALSVNEYLIEKGVDPERLAYKGFGSSNPISDNESESGRAANRRVEFKVLAH